ncbi:hypothetical protein O7628_13420 [Micromonospora sp. WMMD956]|uniref:Lipoprotein n=2 Tax=Micromonosporaceae TaxID=28056 RepID=A0A7H8XDG1_9ACTN|nr:MULTISPECIES: hypothetical protein [Micromonospora]MDG4816498.1 hypothetical protein [Micromonospora sp. WMMD956]QLD23016.1 hypothetical protein HXZ27_01120 [Micromonospora carbonacea]
MRTRRPGRWMILLVTALTAAPVAACGAKPEAAARPHATAGPSATATHSAAEERAAREAALAAYSGYLAASRAASRRSDPRHPELAKFLADPLLTRVRLAIREAKEHGAVRTGTFVSDPTVTSVSLDSVPATVEIQDCLDTTGYRLVDAKTKRVVPGSGGGRHLATATATRYHGRWLINYGAGHEDQPC